MRERARAKRERERKIAKKSQKSRQIAKKSRKIAKHREIANGTRLLALRSRSLRSRSLAHREKYRCAASKIAKKQVCKFERGAVMLRGERRAGAEGGHHGGDVGDREGGEGAGERQPQPPGRARIRRPEEEVLLRRKKENDAHLYFTRF